MTTPITKRPIAPPREKPNRISIEQLKVAVEELNGAVGPAMQRAVRVSELVDAGILEILPDGQLGRKVSAAGSSAGTRMNFMRGDGFYSETLISVTTAPVFISLSSPPGVVADLRFTANTLNRWVVRKGSDAESGADAGSPLQFNRYADAGTIIDTPLRIDRTSGDTSSGSDNVHNLGTASRRWKEIFCANSVINTSDQREKTPVTAMTESEIRVACRIAAQIGTYKWKAALARKGFDARTHIGLTVQEVIQYFADEGLDATRYGFVCYDSWVAHEEMIADAVLDAYGHEVSPPVYVTVPAGDRYSFRYDELLLFAMAGQQTKTLRLESAVDEILNRLAVLEAHRPGAEEQQ